MTRKALPTIGFILCSFLLGLNSVLGEAITSNTPPAKSSDSASSNQVTDAVDVCTTPPPHVDVAKLQVAVTNDSATCSPYRGFYVDLSAALFGWLAVIFALLTVGLLIWGISKYHDLMNTITQELAKKVDKEFRESLEKVVEAEIRPRIQEIVNEELKKTIETAKQRIAAEISQTIQQSDLKDTLIKEVAGEIQKRLTGSSQSRPQEKEFE